MGRIPRQPAMAELSGCEPVATAGFRQKHVKRDEHLDAMKAFIDALRTEQ